MITSLCMLLCAMLSFAPAPADTLRAQIILYEVSQNGLTQRSTGPDYPGQCRRFQVDTFARFAPAYRLTAYPQADLFMPLDHADPKESGRSVGVCWDMPDPSQGNAFVEIARFDYDRTQGLAENRRLARAFLAQLRAGDFVQFLARYNSGGRGTHTVMMTQPYDPREPVLYWADSNFANTLVDGVRHGIVRAYQAWTVDEVVDWLTKDENNGATAYRLSEDVAYRD